MDKTFSPIQHMEKLSIYVVFKKKRFPHTTYKKLSVCCMDNYIIIVVFC